MHLYMYSWIFINFFGRRGEKGKQKKNLGGKEERCAIGIAMRSLARFSLFLFLQGYRPRTKERKKVKEEGKKKKKKKKPKKKKN